VVITPRSTPGGLQIGVSPESNIKAFFLAAREKISSQSIASLFSGLSKTNQEQKFIDDMKEQFRSVRSVSIEVEAGAHMLFVSVDGLSRKYQSIFFQMGRVIWLASYCIFPPPRRDSFALMSLRMASITHG
jgi:hypothetical protein